MPTDMQEYMQSIAMTQIVPPFFGWLFKVFPLMINEMFRWLFNTLQKQKQKIENKVT